MAERVRLHRSVFVRLVAVMAASTLAIVVIVATLFFGVVGGNIATVRRIADDHARLLAAAAPDEARAREIAARLDVAIRFEGPSGSFTTDPALPTIAEAEREKASARGPLRGADFTVAEAPGGGRYLFSWAHEKRLRAAHDRFLVLALLLVLLVVVVAHELIRRSLRPLRLLHAGVERLAEGELAVAVPETSRDEFGALSRAFNAMVTRVREMVSARDRLLRDVSHELRSPLARMKVALELLSEDGKTRGMKADVAEMEALISQLLELERLRDGRGLNVGAHDVGPILRAAAAPFEDAPPGVLVELAAGELPARIDPEKIRTVLRNLLENAAKYALPDSAPVVLSATREDGGIAVRVRDDGPGIPDADRATLFEPFTRVDRSRSKKTGGYGLGLAICRGIVEAHGGAISLESREGRGTTFLVRLPGADRVDQPPLVAPTPEPSRTR